MKYLILGSLLLGAFSQSGLASEGLQLGTNLAEGLRSLGQGAVKCHTTVVSSQGAVLPGPKAEFDLSHYNSHQIPSASDAKSGVRLLIVGGGNLSQKDAEFITVNLIVDSHEDPSAYTASSSSSGYLIAGGESFFETVSVPDSFKPEKGAAIVRVATVVCDYKLN